MVTQLRRAAPLFAPPAAGQHSIVLADSISDIDTDTGGGTGRWHDLLEDRYGIVRVNRTYASNTGGGSFEDGLVGFVNVVQNCTLSNSTSPPPATGLGTHSILVSVTAAVPAINFGGDTGAMRLNMLAGQTYTYSVYIYLAAGHTFTGVFPILYDNDGTGAVGSSTGANLSLTNQWQRLSVTRTLRAGATSAYLRVETAGGGAGQAFHVDGVMLQRGATLTAYADWLTRSAIAGTNLQANDATTNNAVATFSTRIAAWVTSGQITATDWLFVEYGQNDRNYANTSANPTPTTPTTWATGVAAILAAYAALSPKPKLVWLGVPGNGPGYSATNFPTFWPSDEAIALGMDAITAPLVKQAGGLFVPLRAAMGDNTVNSVNTLVTAAGPHPTVVGHAAIFNQIVRALEIGG